MIHEPNATLYVKNIDWKVKKPLVKRALYSLFSRHGKVIEVIVLRRDGLRGQAWVIMEDIQSATSVLQKENGFTFFERDLVIEYAKEKSDRIARLDGTYVPKSKRRKKDDDNNNNNMMMKKTTTTKEDDNKEEEEENEKNENDDTEMIQKTNNSGIGMESTTTTAVNESSSLSKTNSDFGMPSKYLLAQNLPEECNEMMLGMLFRQYNGFQEVRIPRPGLSFIEFDNEQHATLALQALNGFKLSSTDVLQLTYGKS